MKNIPMDPLDFDWNEYAKREQNLMKFYSKRQSQIERIANILFYLGFAFSCFSVFVVPNKYNYIVFALYCALFILRRTILKSRPFGAVIDKNTNLPLPFAILRFAYAGTGVEVIHRITDGTGHYYCLLPNGDYVVQIERKLPDGTYATVASGVPVTVSHGYLAKAFIV